MTGEARPRVLVIDDSADTHDLLQVRLRHEELDLEHALDPGEGLERALRSPPDLVLLDVDMPDMTGFELCQRLKADPRTRDVPVIFLTAAGEVYAKVHGFDLGAVDYVTKPFEPAELRARVRSALRTKRLVDLLSSKAHLDGLTTLWNRSYFDRRLAEELAAAKRYGRHVSLVLVDVDHFKSVNDTHGHPFGDSVLQRLGAILWSCLRTTDAPCRYGGEEFACVLTETSYEGALVAAERIRANLATHEFAAKGLPVRITASFGVASTEGRDAADVTAERLLDGADDALYEAKRGGRDRVCGAPPPPGERAPGGA